MDGILGHQRALVAGQVDHDAPEEDIDVACGVPGVADLDRTELLRSSGVASPDVDGGHGQPHGRRALLQERLHQ